MEKLIIALVPVFAAGMGIQQMIEILSPVFDRIATDYKKVFLGVISLAAGLGLAFGADLYVLHLLGALKPGADETLDAIVTGVIISGGTEGINSLLKFMKYKKEETKKEAAADTPSADREARKMPTVVTAQALEAINRK
jgi:hypothetical protein